MPPGLLYPNKIKGAANAWLKGFVRNRSHFC